MAIVGPSNLITLLDSIPPYWEAGRIIFHERMGNPKTPEGKAQLERQSPLNSAQKIKTPLLVAQGANDPRVKKAESEQIVIALRDRGFPVEYILAPDEGHGFQRPVNSMALWAASEAFFAKHLGGRFQEGGTPEVATRLKEITVDPKTVVLAKVVDAASVGAPKPSRRSPPEPASYQGTIAAGGQNMPMSITRRQGEGRRRGSSPRPRRCPWARRSTSTTVEKATLVLCKRSIKQGPMAIELVFEDGKATGTMAMGGEPKPVSVDLGGPLFADGAGATTCSPRCRWPRATARRSATSTSRSRRCAEAGEGGGLRGGHRAGRDLRGLEGRAVSAEGEPGSTTLWVDKDTRKVVKTISDAPADGRRRRDVRAAAVAHAVDSEGLLHSETPVGRVPRTAASSASGTADPPR